MKDQKKQNTLNENELENVTGGAGLGQEQQNTKQNFWGFLKKILRADEGNIFSSVWDLLGF